MLGPIPLLLPGLHGAQNIGLQGHICQHTPLNVTLQETKINHLTSSLSDFPLRKKAMVLLSLPEY